ncbi:MAG: AMP-binding protein, partial [Candidatus Aenigmatarchaeota archaeon]
YDRLHDSGAKAIITNKKLAGRVMKVKSKLPKLKHIIIVDTRAFNKKFSKSASKFACAKTKPNDPAFMLYTSGTTGRPKGVVHVHKSILLQHYTAKVVLDLKPDDVYWCTADYGWVTGIAYNILGSLSNHATHISYQGRFDAKKWYNIISKYKVSVWYTAPTAIRMLAASSRPLHKLSSLRHICSVGEPLNPEAIKWSIKSLGLPIHDNWWQTETGSILIANYPCMPIRSGSMGRPVPGITANIVNDNGKVLPAGMEGNLAIKPGWPSMMKEIWRNKKKYRSYFKRGWYITGDRAFKDRDNYFWFVGRGDDVIKTSGERVGPFEVESAIDEHPSVIESAVIGKPDKMRGQIIKAFVVLKKNYKPSESLKKSIQMYVKKNLAGHVYPREIEFISNLPKTRSGKIMRRMLKARELGLPIGDTSTLEKD